MTENIIKIDGKWYIDLDLYDEKEKENKQLKERYERLKQEHIDTITRNEEKQQRIDKAIEYIKHYGNLYCLKNIQFKKYKQYEELLEILGDKENESN